MSRDEAQNNVLSAPVAGDEPGHDEGWLKRELELNHAILEAFPEIIQRILANRVFDESSEVSG